MALECGTVVRVEEERVLVELSAQGMCASCSAREGCVSLSDGRKRQIFLQNTLNAAMGDMVEFRVEERAVILSSLLLYLMPVLFLVAGVILGYRYYGLIGMDQDLASGLAGIIFLVLAFLLIRLLNYFVSGGSSLQPRMERIISS